MAVLTMTTPPSTGAYHVAGPTPAGPTDAPVLLTSMSEYRRILGTRTPDTAPVYDELELFFTEGGQEAYLTRVPVSATPAETVAALAAHASAHATGLRGLAVATPVFDADTIGVQLITHVAATGRIALLAPAVTAAEDDVIATAQLLALATDGDHAGLFYPWVTYRDATGRERLGSPTAFAAAARARAHRQVGYFQHPAGDRSKARRVTSLTRRVDRERSWELARSLVSAIAYTPEGIQVYGWWSLAEDRPNFAHLSTRDLLNNIAAALSLHCSVISGTKWANTDQTYAQIRAACLTVLNGLSAAGGLQRSQPAAGALQPLESDPGWRLSMVLSPDRSTVEIRVDVRPLLYARLVGFTLYRIPLRMPIYGGLRLPAATGGVR